MKSKFTLLVIATIVLFSFTQCKKDCAKNDRCKLEPEAGHCLAIIPRYFYDQKDKKCKEFTWGGCDGVVPFETLEACEKQCECK